MKRLIFIYFIFLLTWGMSIECFARKDKNEKKKEKKELGAYQKLFDGKKMTTVQGLMKLHYTGGKVYAEFPLNLLERDMMLTSCIENISDNGEGVVGQFVGTPLLVKFTKLDSTLQARFCVTNAPVNSTGESGISDVLDKSYAGGVYKIFPIEAYTPDSSAVVVNITPLFMEHSYYTNPFSDFAGNSFFGIVSRDHKFKEEKSFVTGVKAFDNNVVVQCQMGYLVDHYVFGVFLARSNVPVSVMSNRILLLLPEQSVATRLADSRVGTRFIRKSDFKSDLEGLKSTYMVRRWNIEPEDEAKYRAGELVEPKKAIVFYMDSIMPAYWRKYVKEGAEAWNETFEKIGFKNVIRVVDFPRNDSTFDANNIKYSTIRYAPVSMFFVQNTMLTDPRTGEILNASIYLHNNFVNPIYFDLVAATMVADPSVRRYELDERVMGESIKTIVTRAVGRSLGLDENFAASYVYPVDSLRSPAFTQEKGLSPSIMDVLTFNSVARPEDVRKGVRLTPKGIGAFDFFTIKWLYQPIAGVKSPKEETPVLDQWIKDYPEYRFGKRQPYYSEFDPSALYGDLGDDHVKTMKYTVENIKVAIPNLFEWFKDQDENMELRSTLYSDQIYLFKSCLLNVMKYFGGITVNESKEGDPRASFEIVPKAKQKEALMYLMDVMQDLSWMDNKELEKSLEIAASEGKDMQWFFFRNIYMRLPYLALCAEKSKDAYSPEEFVQDVYNKVWEGTLKNRPLNHFEMELQTQFLGNVIMTSCVAASPSTFRGFRQNEAISPTSDMTAGRRMSNQEIEGMMNAFQDVKRPNELASLERSGFYPFDPIKANRDSFAPLYYSMLLKIQGLLKSRVEQSSGETKLHYEYLLFKIKHTLEKNK